MSIMNGNECDVKSLITKSMKDTAQQWIDNGFENELITLQRGNKIPIHKNWINDTETSAKIIDNMRKGYNLGIKARTYHALDIEETAFADDIFEFLKNKFPNAAYRYRDGTTSKVILTKFIDPFDLKKQVGAASIIYADGLMMGKKIFEIIGHTQTHIEGTRADKDGACLKWSKPVVEKELPRLDYDDYVEILNNISELLTNLGVINKIKLSGQRLQQTGATTAEHCDDTELEALLKIIPNNIDFADRDSWVEIGHAIYGASNGSQRAKELWSAWSHQVVQHPIDAPEEFWETLRPENVRLGAGVLRSLAQKYDPLAMARMDFENLEDEESKVPFNPLTGADRWLAKDIMRRACMEDRSANFEIKKITRFKDFTALATTLIKEDAIIEGFAYPGIIHAVIAAPGIGKSLWTLRQVVQASLGIATPVRPHVIALFGEDPKSVVGERGLAAEAAFYKDFPAAAPGDDTAFEPLANMPLELFRWEEKTKRIEKAITSGLHRLCDILESILSGTDGLDATKPVVLLFDMMRHVFSGDDNDRKQIDGLFRVMKAIMAAIKDAGGPEVGIVFTHHATKQASRKGETGFSSAGSIGIEGNSRLVSEMRRVDQDSDKYIQIMVTKTNYGQTGQTTYYRKDIVASCLGGDTIILTKVNKQEALGNAPLDQDRIEGLVAALHKALLGEDICPPAMGQKRIKGFPSAWEALQDIPEGVTATEHDSAQIVSHGLKIGAFRVGRFEKQVRGFFRRTEKALLPIEGWKRPKNAVSADLSADFND